MHTSKLSLADAPVGLIQHPGAKHRVKRITENSRHLLVASWLLLVCCISGELLASPRAVIVSVADDHPVAASAADQNQRFTRHRSVDRSIDGASGVASLLRVNPVSFRDGATDHMRGIRTQFRLPLPDAGSALALISDVNVAVSDRVAISGVLLNNPGSSFNLTISEFDRISGQFVYTDNTGTRRVLDLRYAGSGDYVLNDRRTASIRVNGSRNFQRPLDYRLPRSLVAEKLSTAAPRSTRDPARYRAEDPARIDLMVIYTREAMRFFRGSTELLAELNFAIDQTNRAFRDSNQNLAIRLVHLERRVVPECPISARTACQPKISFEDIVSSASSAFGDLESLRDEYGADLVMVIGGDDIKFRGDAVTDSIATRPMRNDWRGVASGYSYLRVDRLSNADYSFARLIGRNLNARGNRADYAGNGVAGQYNYGFVSKSGAFKTIMAEDRRGLCAARGFPECPTVGYFSNPKLKFRGDRLGVVTSNEKRAADNATAMVQVARRVADYRVTKVNTEPSIIAPELTLMSDDRFNLQNQGSCDRNIERYQQLAERDIEDCEGAMISSENPVIVIDANGTQVQKWRLRIGRSMSDSDYFNSGELDASTRKIVINRLLPEDNRTISVQLGYKINNQWNTKFFFYRPYRPQQITIFRQAKWIQAVVSRLSPPDIAGWSPRNKLSIDTEKLAEAAIDRDEIAVKKWRNKIYNRVNGCKDSNGGGRLADENDYLSRCADQFDVLLAIDAIDEAVGSLEPSLRSGKIFGLKGFCLHASSTEALSPVQIMTCADDEPGQQWTQTPESELRVFGNMCLEVPPIVGREAIDGTPTRINYCHADDEEVRPHHKWSFNAGGHIRDPYFDKCLDIEGEVTDDGTEVQIYDCVGVAHQRWWLRGSD